MGEQDALPSTQDAFPIAEPQVIITPQVTSGRVTHALMKFLPREVMVEVVEQERGQGQERGQERWGSERVNLSDPQGVSLRMIESAGDVEASARLCVAAPMISAIDELAQAVVAKAAAELPVDQPSATDLAQPSNSPPSTPPVSKSRSARKRSRLALPQANLSEPATRESLTSDATIADQARPSQEVSPIVELAQAIAAMAEETSVDISAMTAEITTLDTARVNGDAGTPCFAASGGSESGGSGAMTSSPIGPSSRLSALDFSRLTTFADDPPSNPGQPPANVIVRSHRLSRLARWLVPDFVGRAIQHPVLQILAGIGVSLLVFWWILGQ